MFGYCMGYYSFELIKPKNLRDEIDNFILSYIEKNGSQRRIFDKKIGRSEYQQ